MSRFIRGLLFALCLLVGCHHSGSDDAPLSPGGSGETTGPSYANECLAGAWILESESSPLRPLLITDGRGHLIEFSLLDGAGTYNIAPDGGLEMTAGGVTLTGRLTLATPVSGEIALGSLGGWRLSRVPDTADCQGTWRGTISGLGSAWDGEVWLTVDRQGLVTCLPGRVPSISGRMLGAADSLAGAIRIGAAKDRLLIKVSRKGEAITGQCTPSAEGAPRGTITLAKVTYQADTAVSLILAELGAQKGLIINGDDLGMGAFANDGIFTAWDAGRITSISLFSVTMACTVDGEPIPGDPYAEALQKIKEHPGIDVGCHLTLHSTDGFRIRPVLPPDQIPTLVDADGCFKQSPVAHVFASREEILAECRAQIDKALANGVPLTHLDSHSAWAHILPQFLDLYAELADEYRLPLRWVNVLTDNQRLIDHKILVPNKFVMISDTAIKTVTPEAFEKRKQAMLKTLRTLPDGITEILLHPGQGSGPGQVWREVDSQVLADPEVQAQIKTMRDSGELTLLGFRTLQAAMQRLE